MNIEHKIKEIRLSKEFSTKYVAEKSKMAVETYEKIEAGIYDFTFKELESIASALEYTVVDIINYKENIQGVRNYFYNHNGNSGVNIHVQGIDQQEIRKAYQELYKEELNKVPKLEKLLRENDIDFNI